MCVRAPLPHVPCFMPHVAASHFCARCCLALLWRFHLQRSRLLCRPYVWTLVVSHAGMPWSSQAITLFAAPADSAEASQADLERTASQQLSLDGAQRPLTSSEQEV